MVIYVRDRDEIISLDSRTVTRKQLLNTCALISEENVLNERIYVHQLRRGSQRHFSFRLRRKKNGAYHRRKITSLIASSVTKVTLISRLWNDVDTFMIHTQRNSLQRKELH